MVWKKITKHFYSYINKKDYFLATSIVLSSLTTTLLNSVSSYLTDKNNLLSERIQNPINRIKIDVISYNQYQYITNPENWKYINAMENDNKENNNKKTNAFFETINKMLENKDKKENLKEIEVDIESLQKLAEQNKKAGVNNNIDLNRIIKEKQQATIAGTISSIIEMSNKNKEEKENIKNNNLPPLRSKKKREEDTSRYFVVKDGRKITRNDPKEFRKNSKIQKMAMYEKERKKLGIIGGNSITKDENVLESIANIFKIIFNINNSKAVVINSKYDQYGRVRKEWIQERIAENNKKKQLQEQQEAKQKEQENQNNQNVIQKQNEIIENKNDQATNINQEEQNSEKVNVENNLNENSNNDKKESNVENVYNNNIQTNDNTTNNSKKSYSNRNNTAHHIMIDKKLQKTNEYNNYFNQKNNEINLNDLKILSYIEYSLEECWYDKLKKYENFDFSITIKAFYSEKCELEKIKVIKLNSEVYRNEKEKLNIKKIKEDIIETLKNCKINRMVNLDNDNYHVWKELFLTFNN